MFKKSLLLMLLMALFMPWAANAQSSLCDPADQCEISYALVDSYGDGWNGGQLVIVDATESETLATLTISSGSTNDGSLAVCIGHELEFNYTTGSYAYENSWTIYDAAGEVIWESTGSNGAQSQTYTVVCPSCLAPTGLAATLTPGNSTIATLTWTAGGSETDWVLEYGTADDFTGATSVNVSGTPSKDLTGLTPENVYYARVKAVCSGEDESAWTTTSFELTEKTVIGSAASTTSYLPTSTCYNYSLTQQIYTVAELGDAALITSIDFYSTNGAAKPRKFDIYMVSTDKSSFESTTDWVTVTANDLVYSATSYTWQQGWNSFELDTPFIYDGINNVAIVFDDEKVTSYECSVYFNTFAAASQSLYIRQDGADYDPFSTSYEGTVINSKNQIRLMKLDLSGCIRPTGLTVSNITGHTAELSWTENGSATEWIISVNDKELDDPVTENPFVLTELDPETDYIVKVRANCGNEYSDWSNGLPFTTDVACPAPTNVAVSDITAANATVSWTGVGESYNLRYRELTAADFVTVTLTTEDVWNDGSGYQMLLDADATAYGTIIPESGGLTTSGDVPAATYAEFEYKIPTNADGALSTSNIVCATSVTIQIPAGTYDWCITNPTPGDRMWIAAAYGDVGGRQDDYEFEAGKTYEFYVYMGSNGNDAVDVTITENGSTKAGDWTEINDVTSPYTISVEGGKDYIVEVQADCDAEGTSAWIGISFHTPSNCQVPTPLDVTDITAYTATLNWTGVQDSYQVQYRTPASRDRLYFENFDGQPSTWTLTNASWKTGSNTSSDYWVALGYGYTETAYLISPELTSIVSGSYVEFQQKYVGTASTFQVGFSSTTDDVDAFDWGNEIDAAAIFFAAYSEVIPDGTKYIAIQSTTSTTDDYVLINDFGIYGNEIPAGDWTTSTVNNATSCAISGLSGNKEYEWHVRGVNSSCDGGYTEWSTMATFETEPSCLVPTDLDYQLNDNTAVLSWTSTASLFDIKVNETVIEDVTNPYSLTVEPETIYYVSVRAHCDVDDYSDWTDEIAFVSGCSGAKDLPYEFGFENQGEYYACWSQYNTNTTNSMGIINMPNNDLEAYEGDYAFMFSSYSSASTYDQYLFSPELNAENEITVEFYYRSVSGYGSGEEFNVGYSTDGSSFTWGDTISTTTTTWTQYLDTVPAGTKYVAIHYFANYQYYLVVDGFKFEEVTNGVTQTINFPNTGSSSFWFSTYIEMEPVALLEAIETQLGESGVEIKDKNNTTAWDGEEEEWTGEPLQSIGITNDKTYMIKTNAAVTVTLQGTASNPADYEISLAPKAWTWIGFPCGVEVDLENAFANFVPMEGDQIKAKGATAAWDDEEEEWSSSDMTKLIPGTGYMFYSAGTTTRTLIFSTGSTKGRGVNTMGQKTVINKTMGNQVIKHVSLIDKEKTQNNEKQNDQTRQMFKHK